MLSEAIMVSSLAEATEVRAQKLNNSEREKGRLVNKIWSSFC